MIISIPLKDIMISPGKRFNHAEHTDQDVINRIKKLYGVIARVMNIEVEGGMVHNEFRDATPEKFNEAMRKLREQVEEITTRPGISKALIITGSPGKSFFINRKASAFPPKVRHGRLAAGSFNLEIAN